MTLSQIMMLALRQLDEDPQDISEYDDLFRSYANAGYSIALSDYVRPRSVREVSSDANGIIYLDSDVRRVVSLTHKEDERDTIFYLNETGDGLKVAQKNAHFTMICEINANVLENDADEPYYLPETAHAALAEYICFRHLSNGNMAKQSRAQFYQTQFYQTMQRLRPQGFGSVTRFKNLYSATDIRNVR